MYITWFRILNHLKGEGWPRHQVKLRMLKYLFMRIKRHQLLAAMRPRAFVVTKVSTANLTKTCFRSMKNYVLWKFMKLSLSFERIKLRMNDAWRFLSKSYIFNKIIKLKPVFSQGSKKKSHREPAWNTFFSNINLYLE